MSELYQLIFWASFLVVPFLLVCLFLVSRKSGAFSPLALGIMVAALLFVYARFVEPRILLVKHSQIVLTNAKEGDPSIRLALFSDTHFGIFKHAIAMRPIVDRINREAPDALFIAGDFLNYLPADDIPRVLAPLADVSAPVFAVLGNHDVGFPGPVYTDELYKALLELGVQLVENRTQAVTLGGQKVIIAGASDLWEKKQDFSFTADLPDLPLFLLTHNPDTVLHTPAELNYDLMLAGHTHGGQIRIPFLFKAVMPTDYPFDKGLHKVQVNDRMRLVYVTPGTGMVGLPMRFNMPPRIDMLTVVVPGARLDENN